MRKLRTGLVAAAAAAAAAVAASGGIALAQSPQQTPRVHTLTVALPGGGIEQIRFFGTTAPQVTVADAPAPVFVALPAAGWGLPFADFDRISAAMDRQAAQLLREAAALTAAPTQLTPAAVADLPAGAQEYSFVSTTSGNDVCSRSVEITSQGNGAPPKVVTHTSGDCSAGAARMQVPAQLPTATQPAAGTRMIMTRAIAAPAAGGRIEEAALR